MECTKVDPIVPQIPTELSSIEDFPASVYRAHIRAHTPEQMHKAQKEKNGKYIFHFSTSFCRLMVHVPVTNSSADSKASAEVEKKRKKTLNPNFSKSSDRLALKFQCRRLPYLSI